MLILASNSPRRREILSQLGLEFEVEPSRFEEKGEGLTARETVLAFARGKAEDVFSRHPNDVVLGADTVVCLGGNILGKPEDEADAARMLRLLSGRMHEVFTGVCVLSSGFCGEEVVATKVFFHPLEEDLIAAYVKSGLPLDKAGAYGIQDGFPLVEHIEGSYTNVVGLPEETVRALLSRIGGTKW